MAGLFKRFWAAMRGKTNKVLDKMEKPEEQLSVFLEDLNRSVIKMQSSVAAAVVDEKKLKLQLDKLITSSQDWEKKAVLALNSGDENLAREALVRKEDLEKEAGIVRTSWETQEKSTGQLKLNLTSAKGKVDQAKRDYNLLLARYRSAEAKQQMTRTLSTRLDESPMQYLEKLNDKILQLEAETEAEEEMGGETGGLSLDAKFEKLEKSQRGDDALLALKAKINGEQPQLEAGKENDPVEDLKARLKQKVG